jgi:hypothetical protein
MKELRLVVQLSLGLVFAAACAAKLRRPAAFLRGVEDYDLLPRPAALVAGALLIPGEGLLAASLLSGWALGAALPAAAALLAAFAAAIAINLGRHRAVPCHCLGVQGERISPRTLARLGLLLAGALLLAGEPRARTAPLTRWTLARLGGAEDLLHALLLAVLLLAAAAWLLVAPELWALRRARGCPGCGGRSGTAAEPG